MLCPASNPRETAKDKMIGDAGDWSPAVSYGGRRPGSVGLVASTATPSRPTGAVASAGCMSLPPPGLCAAPTTSGSGAGGQTPPGCGGWWTPAPCTPASCAHHDRRESGCAGRFGSPGADRSRVSSAGMVRAFWPLEPRVLVEAGIVDGTVSSRDLVPRTGRDRRRQKISQAD